jgi:acyl-CoA dehydrogenase
VTRLVTPEEFHALLQRVQAIGVEVIRPAARDVDHKSRFPEEAISALRKERVLGAAIPAELGGLGLSLEQVSALCTAIGQHCSASAMIFAMHSIQIACMARHGAESPFFRAYLTECAERQLLIASVTSEVGVGGNMRTSITCIRREGARAHVEKAASVVSYGEHADALLLTARRGPDSPASDQALILLRKGEYTLEKTSNWDTLGMRGTCSPGFKITAECAAEQIMEVPFAAVASLTMVPYSHGVWSSAWLGIATDALSRARQFVRADARKNPGSTPFGATRLAHASTLHQTMRMQIHDAVKEYEALAASKDGDATLTSIGYAIRVNNLKITSSTLVAQIVTECLTICGMAAYANESKFSMGRQLRDALSAALMIANDRINATNATLLLVHKDE